MALVTAAASDSVNDGSGPSTTIEPPQVDNAVDDAIILAVTQSLNNSTDVSNIVMTTPAGYTYLTDRRDVEVRTWIYWKQSTGSETIPTVTSDTSAEWSSVVGIVTDVDWVSGGVNNHVENSAGGDHQSSDITTDSGGTASAIVCIYGLERRNCQGFRVASSPPEAIFLTASANTGNSEGVDNNTGIGFNYTSDRSTVVDGVFWEASGGGDSVAFNIEVLTLGNEVPLQSANLIQQSIQGGSVELNANWCRDFLASNKLPGGETPSTWTFDANTDIDTVNDRITITAHGMDESMVVYLEENGNTAPTGLADDTFYMVKPIDANTIEVVSVNEDTDNGADWYCSGTTIKTSIDITATGTGTITLTEARMISANNGAFFDIYRPTSGSGSNTGSFSGNWIGDSGYNQNYYGTCYNFSSSYDSTGDTLQFTIDANTLGRIEAIRVAFIDSDGDWMLWKIFDRDDSPNRDLDQALFQLQPASSLIQSISHEEFGTFDATSIDRMVIIYRGSNISTTRPAAMTCAEAEPLKGGAFTIKNGSNTTWAEFVDLAQNYTDAISFGVFQVSSAISIAVGNGTDDVSFSDSEKSVEFPAAADGVTTFQNYVETFSLSRKATASSTIEMTNHQIGAAAPFELVDEIAVGATVDFDSTQLIKPNATLDADVSYDGQTFIGGEGVTDNNAEIRNSTFITNDDLGADSGMITWTGTTDIENCIFRLATGTATGHAIIIITPGSYTFTGLTFTDFGSTGTVTAAIYNNSGGAVTITTDGVAPTYRNGAGASTTIITPTFDLTVTSSETGSLIQVFTTTTQTILDSTTGTSLVYTHSDETVDIVVQKAGFLPFRQTGLVLSGDVGVTANLVADLNYVAGHGLTYTTDASWSRTNNELTVPTWGVTGQNVYSLMIDSFIAEATLRNTAFNIQMNGPQSLIFINDAEGAADADIENLTQCGVEYRTSAGVETAEWTGFQSSGVVAGSQPEFEQVSGGPVGDARTTGDVNELIKTFGDVTHGNFDYRNYFDWKVQTNGYRQAELDIISAFGLTQLSPILYIFSLTELEIAGLTLGDPSPTGLSLTDDSAAPVTWDAGDGNKDYSITITDTGSNSGETILRWLNYNLSLDATFEGKDPFNWPEMVLDNGAAYETLRGVLHKAGGDVLAGVRVIDGSGDPHPDFTRFQADDGTYGTAPVYSDVSITGIVAGSRVQIYNVTTASEIYNDVPGTSYTAEYIDGTGYTAGDTVRVRITQTSGVTAQLPFTANTVVTATGWSVLAEQVSDTVYDTFGIDGSTITNFTADYVDDEVDIAVASNFSLEDFYAWWAYNLTTSQGISDFFGGLEAVDVGNFKILDSAVDIYLDNTTATEVYATDNRRLFRDDGARPVKNPTTGGGGVDVEWRNPVLIGDLGIDLSDLATKSDVYGAAAAF